MKKKRWFEHIFSSKSYQQNMCRSISRSLGPTEPAPYCQVKRRRDDLTKNGKGRPSSISQIGNAIFGYLLTALSFQVCPAKLWKRTLGLRNILLLFLPGNTAGRCFSGSLAFQWELELSYGPWYASGQRKPPQ